MGCLVKLLMVTASNYVYRVPTKLFSLSSLYWCMVVLTGVLHIIHLPNFNKPYGLTHELGSIPLSSLRDTLSSLKLSYATVKLQTLQTNSWAREHPPFLAPGHPELPQTILRNSYNLQNYATSKLLRPGKNPVRPSEWSHVQSVSRYGAPSLTGASSLVKGPTRPQTRH